MAHPSDELLVKTWEGLKGELDHRRPIWRERISGMGQTKAIAEREAGKVWTDREVVEALVLAVLSNSVDWSKIERIMPELASCFDGFNPEACASYSLEEVKGRLLPWFLERRSGTTTLAKSLERFPKAVRLLISRGVDAGSMHGYFVSLHERCNRDAKTMAYELGKEGGAHKLPGLRTPLAAEFLKNLGFDVSKPDRHINRAVGVFGWVEFRNWKDREGTSAPDALPKEMLAVMTVLERMAEAAGERAAFVDNAVWYLCAKDGAYLRNEELALVMARAK